ncbi:AraC family transcriptional regulator [Marinimicrobium agarilyticum]|uniref:AraC family transcriptional regulator n=1 Tax=Marinimicrobium agarilyticum TaxID=306546 RepID=UPI000414CC03|nr:AraC family transcriptional regulator ligand-binding domain-containing protein [Marinimicrobium agarilyticum]
MALYDIDTPAVPIHRLPAALIETCLDRDIDPEKLLRGTGIFLEDVQRGERLLQPAHCFRLIENATRLGPAELPFLTGHRLYPGNYGASGAAWTNAENLLKALRTLERFASSLSPLWWPRLEMGGDGARLYWASACGGETNADFLNALMMTAVTSFCQWLGERSFAWHYVLPGPLNYPEQYDVHWGPNVRANSLSCYMWIDRESLLAPWPRASASAAASAIHQATQRESAKLKGFVAYVDQHLIETIDQSPSMEKLAIHLGVSTATLKRRFQRHHTHFQARYDQVRQQLAIEWLTRQGLSLEEVAQRLHFHDGRNLRRAFKRWTGVLPSSLIGTV